MGDIFDVLASRRSCRNFRSENILDEELERIILAGQYAPSGLNRQSAIIINLNDEKVRNQLMLLNSRIYNKPGMDTFYGAPHILVVLADKTIPTYLYDGTLVLGNMMNEAESLGVASCWIHRAKEEFETPLGKKILEQLGIKGEYEGIGHLALGYAAEKQEPSPRKKNYVYQF